MTAMREADLDWRHGRHGAYVWYANDDLEHVLRESFGMFLVENGLGVRAFPSIGRMENEVLSMVRDLLHGDDEAAGIFTSGGTESIFQAMLAMREWARKEKPASRPTVVAPHSAHPALSKAAHIQGFDVHRVPGRRRLPRRRRRDRSRHHPGHHRHLRLGADLLPRHGRPDRRTRSRRRAPRSLAPRRRLRRRHPRAIRPRSGLRRPGLRLPRPRASPPSPPTSTRAASPPSPPPPSPSGPALTAKRARFTFDDWPSGIYTGLTFTGTRPGGAIAAAWAGMNFLGREGYLDLAKASMRAKEKIIAGLRQIPGCVIHGESQLYAFAYALEGVDMGAVAAAMGKRGWVCGRTTSPEGIHVMATPIHEPYAGEYTVPLSPNASHSSAPAPPPRSKPPPTTESGSTSG
jgi:sphinganine-1-phosphate aldolase